MYLCVYLIFIFIFIFVSSYKYVCVFVGREYAYLNREFMLKAMVSCVQDVLKKEPDWNTFVTVHHNYCTCESCRYKDNRTGQWREEELWVTRKGATSAKKDEYGIIPGSMATGSFIVKGLGNDMSWHSCSHGAGRRMGRKQAAGILSTKEFFNQLDASGVVCDRDERLIDESPLAYKDLNEVIRHQTNASIIKIEHRLLPLVNVKGF
ncbi:Protein rtcB [Reticulomyxa filosa]|uniref:3'-phosphate/5'-hydroxy nucleic acid ligase n=1 Tax=Reticulomyxa filosa TaxID=46433 RepID=X6M188_RETFI|nr:Protein rtcB [Reticulomyxa filosa]|eukprot:ETO06755.1 Protein rtcB [Reticulomyxa filosa]